MTTEAEQAIQDARALLDALVSNNGREVRVTTGDTEIYISRTNGRLSPLLAPALAPTNATLATQAVVAVSAPHVATLLTTVSSGANVREGQEVARLRLLDEEIAVLAPCDGAVIVTEATPGQLLEFGVTMLSIRRTA